MSSCSSPKLGPRFFVSSGMSCIPVPRYAWTRIVLVPHSCKHRDVVAIPGDRSDIARSKESRGGSCAPRPGHRATFSHEGALRARHEVGCLPSPGQTPTGGRLWTMGGSIGSIIEGSSFSGLLTRLEIGHIRIRLAGNGRIRSRGSRSSQSQRNRLATNSFEAVVMTAIVRRHNSDYRDAEAIGHRT
jgi:hypothetical protein